MVRILRKPAFSAESRAIGRASNRIAATAVNGVSPVPEVADALAQSCLNNQQRQSKEQKEEEACLRAAARWEAEQSAAREQWQRAGKEAEQRGYADGMKKAQSALEDATRMQAARVATLATALRQSVETLRKQSEEDVIALAFAAVCRILGEHAMERGVVVAMVRETMAGMASGPHADGEFLTVWLHPEDLALLQQGTALPADLAQAQWKADPAIAAGGCMIETARGTLDARLDIQLEAFRAGMLAARARHGNDAKEGGDDPSHA
ncbi:FliH/SctL family protein [Noviherbaspirillum galbum]|uniref:Flagellar assembly protein FliH n=1 Tax=Noviherbaspirillum galbum TaxID=2709383 RepID=A0A6B3SQI5_9BURK|nr:FliH/SctL family protein [Noviherbaspirillum galbum]NEX63027.1 hypothetical protein [Noviherbaspirillum galbum]